MKLGRHLRRLLLTLVLVFSITVFVPAAAGARTIYVSPPVEFGGIGNDITGEGSFAAPYGSLNKGCDVALLDGTVDTIQADYGTYSALTTEAGYTPNAFPIALIAGVTLRGMGFDRSIIMGDGSGNFTVSADAADGARLEGFTVSGSVNGAGVGIQNNVSMVAPVIISGNRITGNSGPFGAGINVANGGSATIVNNVVDNNTASMSGAGICIDALGAATIANNTVTANTLSYPPGPPIFTNPPSGVSDNTTGAMVSVINCNIYGNITVGAENYDYNSTMGTPLVYSIYGSLPPAPPNLAGTGCWNVNPQFDPATTYNVLDTSVAIDMGATPAMYPAVPTDDINETPRPLLTAYDIGAYEWGDFVSPTGSIEVNNGDAYTTSAIVNLAMPAVDTGGSGLGRMRLSNDGTTWTPWWWYAATYTGWNLTSGYGGTTGDGEKTVYVQIQDRAGNVQSTTYSDAIVLASSPPSGTVSIDGLTYLGTKYAVTSTVDLNVTGNDPSTGGDPAEMCFSNDGVTWSPYEGFAAVKTGWSLTSGYGAAPGDGSKTVYVKFRNIYGIESAAPQASDTAILDTTSPVSSTIAINSGALYTKLTAVDLTVGAIDDDGNGVAEMCFSNNGIAWSAWEAYSTSKSGWDLVSGEGGNGSNGTKTVYVRFRDPAGNTAPSSEAGASITLDTIAPTGSVVITGSAGNEYTDSTLATLTITGTDATTSVADMRIRLEDSNWSTWEPYATGKTNFNIVDPALGGVDADGEKYVYIQFRDIAGNSSGSFQDLIRLDRTDPVNPSLSVNGGAPSTSNTLVTLTPGATDDDMFGLYQMCFSNNGVAWSAWEAYGTTRAGWNLTDVAYGGTAGPGSKTVYAKFRDAAGNESLSAQDSIELMDYDKLDLVYDYGSACTGAIEMSSNGTTFLPGAYWFSGLGNFDATRAKLVKGDFNGDLIADIAALYDYGGAAVAAIVLESNGAMFTNRVYWSSGPGNFDWNRAKVAAGDFNADGRDDIVAMYDYGNANTAAIILESSGTTFTPRPAWSSGPGNFDWNRISLSTGDYNGDNRADVLALYDYGNANTGTIVMESDGTNLSPDLYWSSGPGNFDSARVKMTSGDFGGDGKSDVAFLYDYGSANTGALVFASTGATFSPQVFWSSGPGNWDWNRTKLTSGNHAGDYHRDLVALYDYGGMNTGTFVMESTGTAFVSRFFASSGPGNLDIRRITLP